ncbi:hypothetical protein VVD49_01970 [Uliginosibacterium sp. H3]|uniref:Uncharacterized protein n=1 Tax=Uliginosibacterium silvisoli TaxID=3114758 RepID=A0ABU6JYI2_9RHOO|nr:hypothetical protein [Uliginosibacterium sp. H3]
MTELQALLKNIPILPDWAKLVVVNLLGVYVVLQAIHLILKKLQSPEIRSALNVVKNLSGEALRTASRSLQLPVERPRLALLSLVLNAALYYVFALIFFAYFGFLLILASTAPNTSLANRLIAFAASAFFIIVTRWYYASAERQRIAVVERWKALGSERDS